MHTFFFYTTKYVLCIHKWAKVHGKPELYLLLFTMHIRDMPDQSHIKVRSMQRSGTEAKFRA